MTYTLILKNEKSKNYRLISQWLIFFNLLGFVFLLITRESQISNNLWLLFSIVITAVYTFFSVTEWISKKPLADFWHRSVFGYCALAWLGEGFGWFSILLGLMWLFDILAHRKLIVEISESEIKLPLLSQKNIAWQKLNNVVLKDGLLTLDFKNNRLFQHRVLNSDEDIDERLFNTFCKNQLIKQKPES